MSGNAGAAVKLGPGRLEVQQFAMPEPEPGAVVMQFLGVCGTDNRFDWPVEQLIYSLAASTRRHA